MPVISLKLNIPIAIAEELVRVLSRDYVGPTLSHFVIELMEKVAKAKAFNG